MITEDYVSFEIAKLLNEKGFDGVCETSYYISNEGCENAVSIGDFTKVRAYRSGLIAAPTLQMAMKWIREVGNLFIEIDYDSYETEDSDSVTTQIGYSFSLQKKEKPNKYEYIHDWVYDTYEEAAEEAIKYCLINYVK